MAVTFPCPNCGFENQSTSKFCPSCGQSLPKVDEAAERFKKMLEVEVLKAIKDLAERGQTTKEYIGNMARDTLDLLQVGSTMQEYVLGAMVLQNKYPELSDIIVSAVESAKSR
jgi:predicted RNA-binding Zn-ribbon protein involved in translation (DUF1610 family)